MNNKHEQEKKQFKRLFEHQGVDDFDKIFQLLEAFLTLEEHVTIPDIQAHLKKEGIILTDAFVSNSMALLCKLGFASKIEFDHGLPTYEHHHLGLHHDHMICTKCGKILEFRDESLETHQLKVAHAYGFHMLQHKMEIYGICADCMKQRPLMMTLDKARQGENLVIKQIEAGRNLQARVASMGIKIGDPIQIVSAQAGGQVVIASGSSRLIIGKGMAQKITVAPFDKPLSSQIQRTFKDTPDESIPLSQMKAGQEGIITKVTGKNTLRRRLLEMGINRGTHVYIEKYAPLKDPIEMVIKGYHVSIRIEEAANILVENVKNAKNR
jgi:Fur family ferric uptake transcriptional regulator